MKLWVNLKLYLSNIGKYSENIYLFVNATKKVHCLWVSVASLLNEIECHAHINIGIRHNEITRLFKVLFFIHLYRKCT